MNIGATIRYTDANNYYKDCIDATSLIVQKKVSGTLTTLSTVAFAAAAGTNYTIKSQVVGTTLNAKVWATAGSEPGTWMITTTDSSLVSGYVGIRAMVSPSTTVTYTSFIAI